MNKIALSLLSAVVLGQLSWLGFSYHARVQEIAEAPRILLDVRLYDPRDLFRGDYLSLDVGEEIPLIPDEPRLGKSLYWEEDTVDEWIDGDRVEWKYPAREKQSEDAVSLNGGNGGHEIAGFVRADADGVCRLSRIEAWGSQEDVCRKGEYRLPTPMHVYMTTSGDTDGTPNPACRVSLRRALRYYVPEKKGNLPSIARNAPAEKQVRVTMECAYREKNGLIPVQLFVDGVPYLEAYERWEKEQAQKR